MPPNIVEVQSHPENGTTARSPVSPGPSEPAFQDNYNLKIYQSTMNLIAHLLIGTVVGILLIFCFIDGLPIRATLQHIVLCVIGYQLLMAQGIISLSPSNGWSAHLKLVHKRRAHWILLFAGAALATAGTYVEYVNKISPHANSLHGKFGFIALVFAVVSLLNGVTSLWAFELRRFLPSNISKISHICFGIVAFASSSLSLCYGFDKMMFRGWLGDTMTHAVIGFTAIFTFIIIIDPCVTLYSKSMRAIRS